MNLVDFLKYIAVNFHLMPFVVELALVIIALAIIGSVGSYLTLIIFRYRSHQIMQQQLRRSAQVTDLICQYILPEETEAPVSRSNTKAEIIQSLKKMTAGRRNRQLVADLIIAYKKDLRGDTGNALTELFQGLKLDQFSLHKLKQFRNYKKIQGLTELSDMNIITSDVHILSLTRHRSHRVSTIARHAYIKLSKNHPFKFIDTSEEPLLIWDQIQLFRIITTDETSAVPDLGPLLTYSDNPSVVLFCLKLVVYYNQQEAVPAVTGLLDARDHVLRDAAINCLGKLRVASIEPKLAGMYDNQPQKSRVEIIKALGRIKTGKYNEFLKREFIGSDDFTIKKNAAKSLLNNLASDPAGIERLLQHVIPEDQVMLKYCLNPAIKYI